MKIRKPRIPAKSEADRLADNVCEALTLYFVLGHKPYLRQAEAIIKENFRQKKDGDAIPGIFNWFKKFRGDYRSERNAVEREFDRWFVVKTDMGEEGC